MTESLEADTRLSKGGRVVVPAPIRAHLQVSSGDTLRFVVLEDGRVEVITPRLLSKALWATNTGGEVPYSAEAVRAERMRDEEAEVESEERMATDDQDDERAYDPTASTERLLGALGLAE